MGYGQLIKAIRTQRGLTQEQFATQCGMATITIRQYESEKRTPSFEQILRITSALNITVGEFLQLHPSVDTPENQVIAAEGLKAAFETMAAFENEKETEQKKQRRQSIVAAWKAAEEKAGKKLSAEEAMEFYKMETEVYVRLNEAIKKLNNDGRKVALERIEELTLIDKYTLPDIEKHLQKRNEETPPEDQ